MPPTTSKSTHGGLREGAGRPSELEGGDQYTVYLDKPTMERLRTLGVNLSASIRRASEIAVQLLHQGKERPSNDRSNKKGDPVPAKRQKPGIV